MAKEAFTEVNFSCNVMQKWKKTLLTLSGFLCYSYSIPCCTSKKGKTPFNVTSFKKTKTNQNKT